VLSGCGADEAEQKRLELQQGVDAVYFEARPGKRLQLGMSVGTAVFPQDGESYETLLATADHRMYQDKANRKLRSGRSGGGRGGSQTELTAVSSPRELTDGDIQRAASGIL
jgi:GGDEF domain-containing protein